MRKQVNYATEAVQQEWQQGGTPAGVNNLNNILIYLIFYSKTKTIPIHIRAVLTKMAPEVERMNILIRLEKNADDDEKRTAKNCHRFWHASMDF